MEVKMKSRFGEHTRKIVAIQSEIDELYKEIKEKELQIKSLLDGKCDHEVVICFKKPNVFEDMKLPLFVCLNCTCRFNGPLLCPEKEFRIINVNEKMHLFEGMSEEEIFMLIFEYFEFVQNACPELDIDGIVNHINESMDEEIEEVKKRILEDKANN